MTKAATGAVLGLPDGSFDPKVLVLPISPTNLLKVDDQLGHFQW